MSPTWLPITVSSSAIVSVSLQMRKYRLYLLPLLRKFFMSSGFTKSNSIYEKENSKSYCDTRCTFEEPIYKININKSKLVNFKLAVPHITRSLQMKNISLGKDQGKFIRFVQLISLSLSHSSNFLIGMK